MRFTALVIAVVLNLLLFYSLGILNFEDETPVQLPSDEPVRIRNVNPPETAPPSTGVDAERSPLPGLPEPSSKPVRETSNGKVREPEPSENLPSLEFESEFAGEDKSRADNAQTIEGSGSTEKPEAGDTGLSKPEPVYTPQPEYPFIARKRGIEGYVLISAEVSAKGEVLSMEVIEAEPEGVFEDAALEAVGEWRFTESPKASAVRIPVRFELK
ncbi:energy transducer TonB [Limisalsivibrio acetivorans]|uniref:energy transducer TonB n=1 Tax=Limisalsivibrio acetivorans TaxID=1304888 RepID=UPI0003B6BBCD|nr:energy transducer TonB [Limisalsivibrio acetivorans]